MWIRTGRRNISTANGRLKKIVVTVRQYCNSQVQLDVSNHTLRQRDIQWLLLNAYHKPCVQCWCYIYCIWKIYFQIKWLYINRFNWKSNQLEMMPKTFSNLNLKQKYPVVFAESCTQGFYKRPNSRPTKAYRVTWCLQNKFPMSPL